MARTETFDVQGFQMLPPLPGTPFPSMFQQAWFGSTSVAPLPVLEPLSFPLYNKQKRPRTDESLAVAIEKKAKPTHPPEAIKADFGAFGVAVADLLPQFSLDLIRFILNFSWTPGEFHVHYRTMGPVVFRYWCVDGMFLAPSLQELHDWDNTYAPLEFNSEPTVKQYGALPEGCRFSNSINMAKIAVTCIPEEEPLNPAKARMLRRRGRGRPMEKPIKFEFRHVAVLAHDDGVRGFASIVKKDDVELRQLEREMETNHKESLKKEIMDKLSWRNAMTFKEMWPMQTEMPSTER